LKISIGLQVSGEGYQKLFVEFASWLLNSAQPLYDWPPFDQPATKHLKEHITTQDKSEDPEHGWNQMAMHK
jgi:hypothetical protein